MQTNFFRAKAMAATTLLFAVAASISYQAVQAQRVTPSEHKGVSVTNLGNISESSLKSQIA